MRRIGQILRGYVFWTHARGSVHYDVMVTLILAFIFLTPYWVNFNDKPVMRSPHPMEVLVLPDKDDGFIYEINASAVRHEDDDAIREDLLRVIEPIAGEVEIESYQVVRDSHGHISVYRVRVVR